MQAADSEKSTKRRADNWSECEKLTLFQLVSVHIIEDKKTDANAVKKKAAAWNEIYDKFVALVTGGSKRIVKQLKEKIYFLVFVCNFKVLRQLIY